LWLFFYFFAIPLLHIVLCVKKKVTLFSPKVKNFLRQAKILPIVKNCSSIYKIHKLHFLLNL